jgi:microcystin-dependent protein
MEPFLGQLTLVGFTFAPVGWQFAAGQLLSIQQYSALFSLLGTYYGGNGTSNFQLPNLQGNVAIGYGQGAGLSDYVIGETSGAQNVTLTSSTVPTHSHSIQTGGGTANLSSPQNNLIGDAKHASGNLFTAADSGPLNMAAQAVSTAGNNLPHNNMMPYLALNWIIAMSGVFPSRG